MDRMGGAAGTDWKCAREGCSFKHKWKMKPTGMNYYCCNACRNGEVWHTNNCDGHGHRILSHPQDSAPSIPPESATAWDSQKLPMGIFPEFRLPCRHTRAYWNYTTMEYVDWLADAHGYVLNASLRRQWQRTQLVIERTVTETVNLHVHVYRLKEIPVGMRGDCIDVANAYPLDAHSPKYNLAEVTGADLQVQAHLLSQIELPI